MDIPACQHPCGHQWAERVSNWAPYIRYCTRPACGLIVQGPWDQPTLVTAIRQARPKARLPRNVARREALVARLQKRDGRGCYYCGCTLSPISPLPIPTAATVDHYIPLSKGGTNSEENLRAACWQCNHSKSDLLPDDFEVKRVHGRKALDSGFRNPESGILAS